MSTVSLEESAQGLEPSLPDSTGNRRALDGIISEYSDLGFVVHDPLYAIPNRLLDAIERSVRDWLEPRYMDFERAYASLCERFHCLGFQKGVCINGILNPRPQMPLISEEDMSDLGWDKFVTSERVIESLSIYEEISDPVKFRMQAYAGWLLTEPRFLADMEAIRRDVIESDLNVRDLNVDLLLSRNEDAVSQQFFLRERYRQFLRKWKLASMTTWDLPMPLGANVCGPKEVSTLAGLGDEPVIHMASTIRLPAEVMARAAASSSGEPHMSEWAKIQDRNHKSGLNYDRFVKILKLRFYRDTVLASRYSDRFAGNIEPLDEAFADYLGNTSSDATKKLRIEINRRLGREPFKD